MEKPTIEELSITFTQSNDDCDTYHDPQSIIIKTQDSGAGKYLVIETKRWAINNDQDLLDLLGKTREALKVIENPTKEPQTIHLNHEQSEALMKELMRQPEPLSHRAKTFKNDQEIDSLQNSRSGLLGLNDEKLEELRKNQ